MRTRLAGLPDAQNEGAYAIVQALIARGVIGDFRAGDGAVGRHLDILRFGFTPLYIGFADVWHAVEHLRQVLDPANGKKPNSTRNTR
jgi:kynureninase